MSIYSRLINKLEFEKGSTGKSKQHEIVPQFTPEQQTKFDTYKKQLEEEAEKVIMHQKELQQLEAEKPTKFVIPE